MERPTSIKVTDKTTAFLKKLRLNMIRAGASEEALDLSYAALTDIVVNYFKENDLAYSQMVKEIAKNV